MPLTRVFIKDSLQRRSVGQRCFLRHWWHSLVSGGSLARCIHQSWDCNGSPPVRFVYPCIFHCGLGLASWGWLHSFLIFSQSLKLVSGFEVLLRPFPFDRDMNRDFFENVSRSIDISLLRCPSSCSPESLSCLRCSQVYSAYSPCQVSLLAAISCWLLRLRQEVLIKERRSPWEGYWGPQEAPYVGANS